MTEKDNAINNVIRFFTPLQRLEIPLVARDDYVIETPVGCFRLAYSKSTHSMALFYARHANDLAAAATGSNGGFEIAHKGKIGLIKVFDVHHDFKPGEAFDLTWIRRDIIRVAHELPRIHLRECALHRTKNGYSSAFVSYRLVKGRNGKQQIKIITKKYKNWALAEFVGDDNHPVVQGCPTLKLKRKKPDGSFHMVDHVDSIEEARAFIEADFYNRLDRVWKGADPLSIRERVQHPVVQITRQGEVIGHKIKEWRREPAEAAWAIFELAWTAITDVSSLLLSAFHRAGVWATGREDLGIVTHRWRHMLDGHARRGASQSALHKIMAHPLENKFGDFEWLKPKDHPWTFPDALLPPDPAREFRNWFASHATAYYASTIEYRDKNGALVDPQDITDKDVAVARLDVSNGMVFYYVPSTGKVYGYYHRPDHIMVDRKLPCDADDYLKAGQVFAIDLRERDAPMECMTLDSFRSILQPLTVQPLELPSADRPEKDVMNDRRRPAPTTPVSPSPMPKGEQLAT